MSDFGFGTLVVLGLMALVLGAFALYFRLTRKSGGYPQLSVNVKEPPKAHPVWRDGKFLKKYTFDEVRANAGLVG